MNFLNPLAWVGIISIPVILAMYLLKQKHTEMKVPSLFLWREAVNLTKAERPWQKLKRNLLMFLQLLLAFLLVFSLANPYISAHAVVENMVLVLDASMSMQAADVSPSRFEKAKENMVSLVSATKAGSKTTLIVGQAAPYIAVNESADKKLVIDKINAISPTYTAMDVKATADLASMAAAVGETGVFVFTDSRADLGLGEQYALFGESVGNIAVTLVKGTFDADRVVALVKVKNFSTESANNTVALYYDGALHDMKDLSLAPMEEKDVFFTDVPETATRLEARLTREDWLAADNAGYDVVQRDVSRRIMLITEQNVFLENILSLLPGVELLKTPASNMEGLSGCHLYVFDGALPETLPEDGHVLVFNPPAGNALIETGEDAEVTSMFSRDSDLLRLVGDMEFDVAASKRLVTPEWADAVLECDETPLIVSGRRGSQNIVVMGFDLHNTDLPLKKEFPVFMYNIMQYFMPGGAVAGSGLQAGDSVTPNVLPDAKKVSVVTPDERMETLAPPFPAPPFAGAGLPGIYTLVQETGSETSYGAFAVNVNTDESDLTRREDPFQPDEGRPSGVSMPVNRNITPLFLAAALVLLLTEWWVFGRGH